MKFRPSLDGEYKRSWEHNDWYETVKRRLRQHPSEPLARERARLELLLQSHVRLCYADLHERTRDILSNPTWRRLVLCSKWACLERRMREQRRSAYFFDDHTHNDENHAPNDAGRG